MRLRSPFRRPTRPANRADQSPSPIPGRGRVRKRRGWLIAVAVVVGVFLLVELVGTPIATHVVNRRLGALEGFGGHADAVELALWRGAIAVNDFVLHERGHENDLPVVRLQHATMRLAPGALFTGKLGGAAVIDGVEINLVKRGPAEPDKEDSKAKLQEKREQVQRWQEALRRSFPVTLAKLEVKNAKIRFVDRSHQPNPDVEIANLHIIARDLQNRPKANGDPLPAKLQLDGTMTGNGRIHAELQLDPIAQQPRFATKFEITQLSLPPLNNFLRAYSDADVSRGTFELFMEAQAKDGAYDGYIKPLLRDLDFRTVSDEHKNLAEKAKEKVVSAVTSLLKNDDKDQVGTRAPFHGNFADNEIDIWTTVAELFRNAFVQALRSGFEGGTPTK